MCAHAFEKFGFRSVCRQAVEWATAYFIFSIAGMKGSSCNVGGDSGRGQSDRISKAAARLPNMAAEPRLSWTRSHKPAKGSCPRLPPRQASLCGRVSSELDALGSPLNPERFHPAFSSFLPT